MKTDKENFLEMVKTLQTKLNLSQDDYKILNIIMFGYYLEMFHGVNTDVLNTFIDDFSF